MRLKSWESPRRQGRNDKGKGGSARQRQLRKQMKMLTSKLKQGIEPTQKKGKHKEREIDLSFFCTFVTSLSKIDQDLRIFRINMIGLSC